MCFDYTVPILCTNCLYALKCEQVFFYVFITCLLGYSRFVKIKLSSSNPFCTRDRQLNIRSCFFLVLRHGGLLHKIIFFFSFSIWGKKIILKYFTPNFCHAYRLRFKISSVIGNVDLNGNVHVVYNISYSAEIVLS